MSNLTPAQHAQLGCDYLDELLHALQSNRWCFDDTFGIERKISGHAEALGIATPLERPSKPELETAGELQVWLKMHDPLTDSRRERLISRMIFAPLPASKGTVLKTMYCPLDEREQVEFRQFVDRLRREMRRRGAALTPSTPQLTPAAAANGDSTPSSELPKVAATLGQAAPSPAATEVPSTVAVTMPDGFYSPTDIAKAMIATDKANAIRMALKRLFDENLLPDGAWLENSNPAKGQAKILYRLSKVRPLLARFEPPQVA